jgi:hypothetical protein
MLKLGICTISIGFAVVALWYGSFVGVGANVPLIAAAGSPQTQSPTLSSPAGQSPQVAMAEMMKRHQQMMADIKAADLKLEELVKDMNAATGEAKIAAIAQVVNELVRQQKTMHEHMATMNQQMMMQMMGGRGMMNK